MAPLVPPNSWRRHASMLSSSFKEVKEGAAAIEAKEGKDANGDKEEPDPIEAEDYAPDLHGTTENDEVCRCLPNAVEAPRAAWLLKQAARGLPKSRAAHREVYRKRLDEVELATREKLDALYKAEKYRDYAFEDLYKEAKKTEEAAFKLDQAYSEIKDAYSEGDCLRVVEKAAEHGDEIPECQKMFEKSIKEMKEVRALISPECRMGALDLKPLQTVTNKGIAGQVEEEEREAGTVQSLCLSPRILAALSILTGSERRAFPWEVPPSRRRHGEQQHSLACGSAIRDFL